LHLIKVFEAAESASQMGCTSGGKRRHSQEPLRRALTPDRRREDGRTEGLGGPSEPLARPASPGAPATAPGTRKDAPSQSFAGSGCKTRKEGRKRVGVCVYGMGTF